MALVTLSAARIFIQKKNLCLSLLNFCISFLLSFSLGYFACSIGFSHENIFFLSPSLEWKSERNKYDDGENAFMEIYIFFLLSFFSFSSFLRPSRYSNREYKFHNTRILKAKEYISQRRKKKLSVISVKSFNQKWCVMKISKKEWRW